MITDNNSNKTVTIEQKCTVHYCEQMLNIVFNGDIDDPKDVQEFLFKHLEDANKVHLQEEYEDEYDIFDLID